MKGGGGRRRKFSVISRGARAGKKIDENSITQTAENPKCLVTNFIEERESRMRACKFLFVITENSLKFFKLLRRCSGFIKFYNYFRTIIKYESSRGRGKKKNPSTSPTAM